MCLRLMQFVVIVSSNTDTVYVGKVLVLLCNAVRGLFIDIYVCYVMYITIPQILRCVICNINL